MVECFRHLLKTSDLENWGKVEKCANIWMCWKTEMMVGELAGHDNKGGWWRGRRGPFSHSSRDVYESRPPGQAVFQHDFEISAALLDVV